VDAGGVVVILALVAGFGGMVAYYYIGGVGGALGKAQGATARATALARPAAATNAPAPPGTLTISPLPAGLSARTAALAAIEARYENDLLPVEVGLRELVPEIIPDVSLNRLAVNLAEDLATLKKTLKGGEPVEDFLAQQQVSYLRNAAPGAVFAARFTRTLRDFSDAERAALRLAEILAVLGYVTALTHLRIRAALVWNEGRCLLHPGAELFLSADRTIRLKQALGDAIQAHCGLPVAALERVQQALRLALDPAKGLPAAERELLSRFVTTGARWLTPLDAGVGQLCADPAAPGVLRLGVFPGTGEDLLYDRRESLTTFAMPGSGKSLALVLRNLLYLKTPAVVLDIKGELAAASAAWRAKHVGPVYVFSPRDPAGSVGFNPFARVSEDPDDAWEDTDKLAALLAVPTSNNAAGESYWDRRGRRVLASVLLEVALSEEDENRTMLAVRQRLARMANKPFLQEVYFPRLQALGVPDLLDLAEELQGLSDDQLPGLIDTARGYIQQWGAPRVTKVTTANTFTPDKLRAENATLYINVELEDVRRYASILRALLGQCIGHLCSGVPDRSAAPVTFFLDEFPQLGRFDEVARALDLGRGFGVRFWLFAQSIHHLREAYANAEGMLGSCYVRSFINPTEGDAQWLSTHLGERHGLLDGERRPLAEPSDLAGARYADKLVCFIARSANAALETVNAYADPVCRTRMGL
jgi:type IV secretion system protein VirD4